MHATRPSAGSSAQSLLFLEQLQSSSQICCLIHKENLSTEICSYTGPNQTSGQKHLRCGEE